MLSKGTDITGFLSFSERIFKSDAAAKAFIYLCQHGAATAWALQSELDIPEATVYRMLKKLRAMGVVRPALKATKGQEKGGPRPIVWALEGSSDDQIAVAMKLHFRKMDPKYRIAEEIAQTILDKFNARTNEITYREIIIHIKESRVPFRAPDIADMTAEYLTESGMKVWR